MSHIVLLYTHMESIVVTLFTLAHTNKHFENILVFTVYSTLLDLFAPPLHCRWRRCFAPPPTTIWNAVTVH